MVTPREAALTAIAAGRKSKAWPDAFLDNLVKKERFDRRDAALVYRMTYGVLQNMALCDYYISAYSSIELSKIEPIVLDILRLSVYQLAFLDRIPAHAAVSEGVELARKKSNPRAAGFVNAVLRKAASNGMPEIKEADDIKYLSIKYSHPEWLVRLFLDELGREDCEKYLAANNELVPIYAQVNTLKATGEQVLSRLRDEGINVKETSLGLELVGSGNLEDIEVFKDGSIYIQDGAARIAVEAAGVKPDMNVLDGCAAPGGKSFAAAIMMENRGHILSRDIHEKKLKRILREGERLGISIIETEAMDARVYQPELEKSFDAVIADVPCSGLGVIRKKPDIRYKDGDSLSELPEIQLDILRNLSKYCKSGGTVLYSTCTVLNRENSGVVEKFLAENEEFQLEAFETGDIIAPKGMITLYPHIHGTDGFFIAKLRRR
ncbi:MAG: 16S rRNA (cytosine(967)-C(5))-methyltransferase RsmB [Ruminococcaceae bacterium]|nr:16S rRNA (cytosine(967)-C(5))-methyltransferase RsmB [Oscillospiraceae bacterium]